MKAFGEFSASDHWDVAAKIERLAAYQSTATVATALRAFAQSERVVARAMGYQTPSELRSDKRAGNRRVEGVHNW